jgi:hypothetical protein
VFSWSLVQLQRGPIQVRLRVGGQVGALREVLAEETVRVLIGSALPRTLRIAEVDLYGWMPPLVESTKWIDPRCFASARAMSFIDCPRFHRFQNLCSCEAEMPAVLFVSFSPSPIYQVKQKMLHRPIEPAQDSVK